MTVHHQTPDQARHIRAYRTAGDYTLCGATAEPQNIAPAHEVQGYRPTDCKECMAAARVIRQASDSFVAALEADWRACKPRRRWFPGWNRPRCETAIRALWQALTPMVAKYDTGLLEYLAGGRYRGNLDSAMQALATASTKIGREAAVIVVGMVKAQHEYSAIAAIELGSRRRAQEGL